MSLRLFFALIARTSRGARGRLSFVCACVALGAAAVVGVAALVDAVELGIRVRSRELLGGDLALESRRPLPDLRELLPARYRALPRVELCIFSTMVRNEAGASQLAELKAVSSRSRAEEPRASTATAQGAFPLAGELILDPPRPLDRLLDEGSVLVAPELKASLKLALGDSLYVGGVPFRVAGVVKREPDPIAFSLSFGARVLMSRAGLARTSLLGFGHRVRYRTLLALPPETSAAELTRVKQLLERSVPGGGSYVSVETHAEAQPALRKALERVQRYLGLVALLSLLVASVGVAQIVSGWLREAAPETAIMRCLGLRPREVLALYLGHVLWLALLGSVAGSALAAVVPALVARGHPELIPAALAWRVPWPALARGICLGVGVAALVSLPALIAVWQVPPARVLRSEAAPLPIPRAVRALALACATVAVALAAFVQGGEAKLALSFAAGVAALSLALWLGARGLSWAAARLPRGRLPLLIWQGIAALGRPSAGVIGGVVALGLGTLVVSGLALVEGVLDRELETVLPPNAPSVFLVDIQPEQWSGVAELTRGLGATRIESVPVATARLLAVDGRPVSALLAQRPGDRNERDRAHWVLTREQRVSWMKALPPDNRIIAGALWSDPSAPEISVEAQFANDLGAKVGSVLGFDVQGVPMEFKVTSVRTVEWRSFSTNFFLVAEPGVLEEAPHFRLGAIRVPARAEQALQDRLAASFPNVTMLRVRELVERALGVLRQAGLAVRVLGGFAMATGLAILAAAVASSQLRRAREVALLKTLGVTRAQVIALFAVEYALSGALAGVLGACGAYLLAIAFTRTVLELASAPSPSTLLLTVAATSALSTLAGLSASVRALRVRPLDVLRR